MIYISFFFPHVNYSPFLKSDLYYFSNQNLSHSTIILGLLLMETIKKYGRRQIKIAVKYSARNY